MHNMKQFKSNSSGSVKRGRFGHTSHPPGKRIGYATNRIVSPHLRGGIQRTFCSASDGLRPSSSDGEEEREIKPKSVPHPEINEGDEGYMLPEFLGHKAPPGWVKCYLPSSSVDPTKSLEEFWERTVDVENSQEAASSSESLEHGFDSFVRHDVWTLTDQPGIDMFAAGSASWSCLRRVFVILFGVGERETEGIYSLRAFKDDGLPLETIIAFEEEEDAQRYAGLLEATMEHVPSVCNIQARELLDFCSEQGYNCRLVPIGSLLIPPDYNVNVTDWERSLRLRDGCWAVLEEEPQAWGSGQRLAGGSIGSAQLADIASRPNSHAAALARYTGFSDADVENIRAKLEKLLN